MAVSENFNLYLALNDSPFFKKPADGKKIILSSNSTFSQSEKDKLEALGLIEIAKIAKTVVDKKPQA